MPNTTNFTLPYPQASDTVDVPRDISALASSVDTALLQTVRVFASTTARDTAITAPTAGMICYVNSNDSSEGLYTYAGATGGWIKGPGWNTPWGVVGYVQATSSQGSITTAVDVTSITHTATYVANRLLRISVQSSKLTSTVANDRIDLFLYLGASNIGQAVSAPVASAVGISVSLITYATSVAGSQTIKVQISRSAASTGTVATNATASAPFQMIIEDIGPAGAPA